MTKQKQMLLRMPLVVRYFLLTQAYMPCQKDTHRMQGAFDKGTADLTVCDT